MAILSKVISSFRPVRNISTSITRKGLVPNADEKLDEMSEEPHGETVRPYAIFSLVVLIPLFSAYAWWKEYEHLVLHRQRRPWPKYEFLNQRTCKFFWGDGEHTAFHHPYWNFTPYGYETDKDGNPLPKGVYVEE